MTPFPPVCPPSPPPGFVGLSGGARLPGRAASATASVATDAAVTLGGGTGQRWAQTLGQTCRWHFCNGKAGMWRRSGGKKAFWSNLGYFCRVRSGGFRFGNVSRLPPLLAALHRKPSHATETLGFGLLGLKGSEFTRLGNKLGFLFPFFPQTCEGGAAPPGVPGSGGSWSEGPCASPALPRPGPGSARLRREAAFKAPSSRVDSVVSVSYR